MKCYHRIIRSGKVIEHELYCAIRPKGKSLPRGANIRESTTQQKQLNEIRAKRWLTRLVNCNFVPGDSYITLTYKGIVPTPEEATKNLARFLRRLRDWRKRNGLPALKYIWVTEYRDGSRIHHHIITQGMPEQMLIDLWQYDGRGKANGGRGKRIPGHGRAPCDRLDDGYDYTFLAEYIGKEGKAGKRWGQSKSLKTSVVLQEKEISYSRIRRAYRPPNGYRVSEERYSYNDMSGDYRYIRIVPFAGELKDSA